MAELGPKGADRVIWVVKGAGADGGRGVKRRETPEKEAQTANNRQEMKLN